MKSIDMIVFRRLMIYLGMWYPRSTETRSRLLLYTTEIRHIVGFTLWFLILYSVYVEGFRKSMQGTAFYVVIGTLCNLFIVVFYFKRKDTHVLVTLFDKILSTRKYNWEIEFVQTRAKFIWNYMNLFNNFFVIYTNVVFGIIPVLNWFLKYYEFGSISFIPLPLRALSEKKCNRNYLAYIWDILGCLWSYLAISLYLGPLDSFVMLTSYTGIEIELLCEKIRLLSLNDDEHYSFNCSKNDITLMDIIQHHQTILRLSNQLKLNYGFCFAVMNNVLSMCVCLALITVSTEISRDLGVAMSGALVGICLIIQMFGICFVGSYLQDRSENITKSLYDLPWYRLPPKTRQILNMMMMQAVKPIVVDYRGMVPITLNTFIRGINASYSYFALLRSLIND